VQLKKKQKLKASRREVLPGKELKKQRRKASLTILMRRKHISCRKFRMGKS